MIRSNSCEEKKCELPAFCPAENPRICRLQHISCNNNNHNHNHRQAHSDLQQNQVGPILPAWPHRSRRPHNAWRFISIFISQETYFCWCINLHNYDILVFMVFLGLNVFLCLWKERMVQENVWPPFFKPPCAPYAWQFHAASEAVDPSLRPPFSV